jgi:hypothetical protein
MQPIIITWNRSYGFQPLWNAVNHHTAHPCTLAPISTPAAMHAFVNGDNGEAKSIFHQAIFLSE